jgi:hypothetical protein
MNCAECGQLRSEAKLRADIYKRAADALQHRAWLPLGEYKATAGRYQRGADQVSTGPAGIGRARGTAPGEFMKLHRRMACCMSPRAG